MHPQRKFRTTSIEVHCTTSNYAHPKEAIPLQLNFIVLFCRMNDATAPSPASEMHLSCIVLLYSVSTGMRYIQVEPLYVRVHTITVVMSAGCQLNRVACATLPFLELGTTPGLRPILLPAEDDGVSEAVSPPQGLPIWGTFYSNLYVSDKARATPVNTGNR